MNILILRVFISFLFAALVMIVYEHYINRAFHIF